MMLSVWMVLKIVEIRFNNNLLNFRIDGFGDDAIVVSSNMFKDMVKPELIEVLELY